MKFNVKMLAFMNGETREVDVPNLELTHRPDNDLEKIFFYGQNDFQQVEGRCSVSVGDVIEYENKLYLVMGTGFKEISPKELDEFKKMATASKIIYCLTLSNT